MRNKILEKRSKARNMADASCLFKHNSVCPKMSSKLLSWKWRQDSSTKRILDRRKVLAILQKMLFLFIMLIIFRIF